MGKLGKYDPFMTLVLFAYWTSQLIYVLWRDISDFFPSSEFR